ncbi:MAG: hypothetical protein KKD39_03285, partial [Candidatus Altiarchaeota archaeon]|nr:hypothetical protein [Candidatus Altiarchaeota archaeon]
MTFVLTQSAEDIAEHVGPFSSQKQAVDVLKQKIPELLNIAGLGDKEVTATRDLMDMIETWHEEMGLVDTFYHNYAHALTVAYGSLITAMKTPGLITSDRDVKVVFLAGLLHDFHLRETLVSESGEAEIQRLLDTAIQGGFRKMEAEGVTLEVFRRILEDKDIAAAVKFEFLGVNPGETAREAYVHETLRQLKELLGPEMWPDLACEIGAPNESKFEALVSDERKERFRSIVTAFLGDEAVDELRDVAVGILATDFAYDTESRKTILAQYERTLETVREERKEKVDQLAQIVKVTDLFMATWLYNPETVAEEIIASGLQREVLSVGYGPENNFADFYYPILILDGGFLEYIARLPERYRKNFLATMEHFVSISSSPEAQRKWDSEKQKVHNILGLADILQTEDTDKHLAGLVLGGGSLFSGLGGDNFASYASRLMEHGDVDWVNLAVPIIAVGLGIGAVLGLIWLVRSGRWARLVRWVRVKGMPKRIAESTRSRAKDISDYLLSDEIWSIISLGIVLAVFTESFIIIKGGGDLNTFVSIFTTLYLLALYKLKIADIMFSLLHTEWTSERMSLGSDSVVIEISADEKHIVTYVLAQLEDAACAVNRFFYVKIRGLGEETPLNAYSARTLYEAISRRYENCTAIEYSDARGRKCYYPKKAYRRLAKSLRNVSVTGAFVGILGTLFITALAGPSVWIGLALVPMLPYLIEWLAEMGIIRGPGRLITEWENADRLTEAPSKENGFRIAGVVDNEPACHKESMMNRPYIIQKLYHRHEERHIASREAG